MTREEAIDRLTYLMSDLNEFSNESKHMSDDDRKELESLDMAIRVLEQEPCEDAVSRAKIKNKAIQLWNGGGDEDYKFNTLIDYITELPSVTSTSKKGKWVRHYCNNGDLHHITCSNCHTWHENFSEYRYCPYCGADMRGEE